MGNKIRAGNHRARLRLRETNGELNGNGITLFISKPEDWTGPLAAWRLYMYQGNGELELALVLGLNTIVNNSSGAVYTVPLNIHEAYDVSILYDTAHRLYSWSVDGTVEAAADMPTDWPLIGNEIIGSSGSSTGRNSSYVVDNVSWVELTADPACYCRGTLIQSNRGEVPIEDLATGESVVTFAGATRQIKWIGRRAYDPRFIAGNTAVLPIRIEAGALGDGIPARDLFVSPEHALYIDGALVPAQLLVNGATIRRVESIDHLEYFHIELDTHDVILADGMPAETFVDCDNRGMFQNAAEFWARYPEDDRATWEFFVPRLELNSDELIQIRTALINRAEALGRISRDPDLHLIVDGEIVRAKSAADRVYYFVIPAGARAVSLASRSAVPAEVETSSLDGRSLGVAVERIALCGPGLRIEIGYDCPALCDGFHEAEVSHRWSTGQGSVPEALLVSFGGGLIEVHLAETEMRYGLVAPAAASTARSSKCSSAKQRAGTQKGRR